MDKQKGCDLCHGHGTLQCGMCHGVGHFNEKGETVYYPDYTNGGKDCYVCHGHGKVPCSHCGGSGKVIDHSEH